MEFGVVLYIAAFDICWELCGHVFEWAWLGHIYWSAEANVVVSHKFSGGTPVHVTMVELATLTQTYMAFYGSGRIGG